MYQEIISCRACIGFMLSSVQCWCRYFVIFPVPMIMSHPRYCGINYDDNYHIQTQSTMYQLMEYY